MSEFLLSGAEAEALAARTHAEIKSYFRWQAPDDAMKRHLVADQERVTSDLAGLRLCWSDSALADSGYSQVEMHARRYCAGLLRTAALYGVTL